MDLYSVSRYCYRGDGEGTWTKHLRLLRCCENYGDNTELVNESIPLLAGREVVNGKIDAALDAEFKYWNLRSYVLFAQ